MIDHFLCFISGDTSQNLQGLGLLASQLHLASAFWLHRMNMLKKPEEIKKKKHQTKTGSWERMPRSESRKVNKPRRNKNKKQKKQGPGAECPDPVTISLKALIFCFFCFFLIFSRFFTFQILTWAFSPRTLIFLIFCFFDFFEVFAVSWVSCPSPLSIFLAVLELWRTELQFFAALPSLYCN